MLTQQRWTVRTGGAVALAGLVCFAGMSAIAAESLRLNASHQRLATKNNGDGTATVTLAITLTNTGSVAARDLRLVLLDGPGLPVMPGKNVLAVGTLAAGQRMTLTWPIAVLAPVAAARVPLIVIHAEGIAAGGTMPVSTGVLSRAGNNPRASSNEAIEQLTTDAATARCGSTERVSVDSAGNQGNDDSFYGPGISANGRFVTFGSFADNLVPGDTNHQPDVFVHDRKTGVTERVSVDSAGNQGNNGSAVSAISADGRFVAFDSLADNLVPGDTNRSDDIFVHDRKTGTTERVSVDSAGNQGNSDVAFLPAISADGRFVAFWSGATNLVPGDTNRSGDIFVHDRKTGLTERVSVDSAGDQGNSFSGSPAISASGRFVAFGSSADNLVASDTNRQRDVFVHDRKTGTTERVSIDSAGNQGNGISDGPVISASGRFVAFFSVADNLIAGDTNRSGDIFVHDRKTGTTERVNVDSAGHQQHSISIYGVGISGNGRRVAYVSLEARGAAEEIFVHDRKTGTTERVSVDSAGNQANGPSGGAAISANGRFVAFASAADNVVPGDTNRHWDIFVHDRAEE